MAARMSSMSPALKRHSCVFKAERHSEELKEPKRHYDGCFLCHRPLKRNLKIAIFKIQGAEHGTG